MGCTESSNQTRITKNDLTFPPEQIEAFRRTFESADSDADKRLGKSEFRDLIRNSGEKKTDNQIECLVKQNPIILKLLLFRFYSLMYSINFKWYSLEQDETCRIDFEAFLSLLDGTYDDKEFADNLAGNIFDEFDKDKTGFLNLEEFKKVVNKLETITQKEKSTRIEMDAKFREVDLNNNQKLTKDEVIKAINNLNK